MTFELLSVVPIPAKERDFLINPETAEVTTPVGFNKA